jgi:tetratricopeptide (TPR) repeat protein
MYLLGLAAAVPLHAWSRRSSELSAEPDRAAVKREPARAAAAHRAKGEELSAGERHREALAEFNEALRLDPSDAASWCGRGLVYRKLLLEAQAEEAFRKAYELSPDHLPARDNLAMVLYDTGQHGKAEVHLRRALERRPDDPFLWAEMALNRMRLGRPAEAITLLERYNAKQGRTAWGLSNLGRAHAEAGQSVSAERCYREALQSGSPQPVTCFWLGQLLVSLGRKDEGDKLLETYRRLRRLETEEEELQLALMRGEDWRVLANLGRVRFLLKKFRSALGPVERALELAPGDEQLPRLHRDILEALERLDKSLP